MAPSKDHFSSRVVGKIVEKCIEKKMIQGGTKNRKAVSNCHSICLVFHLYLLHGLLLFVH